MTVPRGGIGGAAQRQTECRSRLGETVKRRAKARETRPSYATKQALTCVRSRRDASRMAQLTRRLAFGRQAIGSGAAAGKSSAVCRRRVRVWQLIWL